MTHRLSPLPVHVSRATRLRGHRNKPSFVLLRGCLALLCFAVAPVLGACDECTFSNDPHCGDDTGVEEPDQGEPVAGRSAEVDICGMVPGADGTCSELEVPDEAANLDSLIARGNFTGSSIDVSEIAGSTFDLVSIQYAQANEFSERGAEACDEALAAREAGGELHGTRRFTALGGGNYLDEDVRRFGSEDRVRVRIVRGPSTLTPDTTCQTCSASGTGSDLDGDLVETRFRGSATRDRMLVDDRSTGGAVEAFVLVEAVAYLPPPLPDQDVSVVDCEAALRYVLRD